MNLEYHCACGLSLCSVRVFPISDFWTVLLIAHPLCTRFVRFYVRHLRTAEAFQIDTGVVEIGPVVVEEFMFFFRARRELVLRMRRQYLEKYRCSVHPTIFLECISVAFNPPYTRHESAQPFLCFCGCYFCSLGTAEDKTQ